MNPKIVGSVLSEPPQVSANLPAGAPGGMGAPPTAPTAASRPPLWATNPSAASWAPPTPSSVGAAPEASPDAAAVADPARLRAAYREQALGGGRGPQNLPPVSGPPDAGPSGAPIRTQQFGGVSDQSLLKAHTMGAHSQALQGLAQKGGVGGLMDFAFGHHLHPSTTTFGRELQRRHDQGIRDVNIAMAQHASAQRNAVRAPRVSG